HFADPSGDPGFFFTADDHEKLFQRPKGLQDQAIPSGTAVALASAIALKEIGEHLGQNKAEFHAKNARAHLEKLKPALVASPFGYGELANTLHLEESGLRVFGGARANAAIHSTRDFAVESKAFPRSDEARLQVCERGICREIASSPYSGEF